jgi:Zn-dependent protease
MSVSIPLPAEPAPYSLRFRLGPFPVAVDPTFWFVALFPVLTEMLRPSWVPVLFGSILVHELGHALAARRFGSPASIRIYLLGGLTTFHQLPDRRQRILVALAGPVAGFALGLLTLAAYLPLSPARGTSMEFTLHALLWLNFGWGVVNLLPVPPLDGGQMFAEAVGPRRTLLAAQVGAVVGAVAMLEALRRWGVFAAVMFGYLAYHSALAWLRLAREQRLRGQLKQARETLWEDALGAGEVGEAHRAVLRETMQQLRQPPPTPAVPAAPTVPAAPAAPAYDPDVERDHALLAQIFGGLGATSRAADHALEAHRREPSDGIALHAVQLLIEAGRRLEAEKLVARARWSAASTRAKAEALLTRSRN